MNLSRIEAGRIDLRKRRVDPGSLIRLAIDTHEAAAAQTQIALRVEVPPGLPEIFADPDRMQLVFTNLVGNALRYAPPGSEIVLRARAAGSSGDLHDHRISIGHACAFRGVRSRPGDIQATPNGVVRKILSRSGKPQRRFRVGIVHRERVGAGARRHHRRRQRAGQGLDVLVHDSRGAARPRVAGLSSFLAGHRRSEALGPNLPRTSALRCGGPRSTNFRDQSDGSDPSKTAPFDSRPVATATLACKWDKSWRALS